MAIRDTVQNPGIALNAGPFLIIGLGNVGDEYEMTRHNAGFRAVDHFVNLFELGSYNDKADLSADVVESNVAGEKVVVAKPKTFMNKSGLAVVKLQNYFGVNDPRIMIVYDDVDLEFGTIRSRVGGSSGGHNGLRSIEQVIGDGFARIRIGVKSAQLERMDTADFVLSRFSRTETSKLDEINDYVAKQIELFVEGGFEGTSYQL